jgi:hypothetical protein
MFEVRARPYGADEMLPGAWSAESMGDLAIGEDGVESSVRSSSSFRHTSDLPGTYRCGCAIHPGAALVRATATVNLWTRLNAATGQVAGPLPG